MTFNGIENIVKLANSHSAVEQTLSAIARGARLIITMDILALMP